MDKELEKILGQAHENIRNAVKEKKDLRTSVWLVETLAKYKREYLDGQLLRPLIRAVETFEDIERVSKQALLLAIEGEMTLEQLKAIQEALARHSVLKGVVEIGDLRRELKEIQELEVNPTELGNGHLPSWGRLIEHEPVKNGHANGRAKEGGE